MSDRGYIDKGGIKRSYQMNPYTNIVHGAEIVGSHLIREALKDTTKNAPTIGAALGGVVGSELGPQGVAVGSWIGKKAGAYAQKESNKLIDKL